MFVLLLYFIRFRPQFNISSVFRRSTRRIWRFSLWWTRRYVEVHVTLSHALTCNAIYTAFISFSAENLVSWKIIPTRMIARDADVRCFVVNPFDWYIFFFSLKVEVAVTLLVDFRVDSSSRSVNITSYLIHIITHHPLHAMMTNYAADRTSPLAQAFGRAIVVLLLIGQ